MRGTVSKWGNSLGLRVPNQIARLLGLQAGSQVDLEIRDDQLIVRPAPRRYTLSQLVDGITSENQHGEIASGPAVGAEVIDE